MSDNIIISGLLRRAYQLDKFVSSPMGHNNDNGPGAIFWLLLIFSLLILGFTLTGIFNHH